MATDYPKTRLYVESDLRAGDAVRLSAGQTQHVARVLRLGPGAPVALFNGRDGEWLARLAEVGRKSAAAVPERRRREQRPDPDIHLLCAPLKRHPFDLLAEKATELGVAAVRPVMTARTVPGRVNTVRLRAIAIEAAEQCERLTVPEVAEPVPLGHALDRWPDGRRLLLCDETGGGRPVGEALREAPSGAWAILTGPEGGFARGELDALADLPFVVRVGLGPRILRAETAAIAALAVWQALLGDWAHAPSWQAPTD